MAGEITPLDRYRDYPREVIILADWLHDHDRLDEAHAVLDAHTMGKLAVLKTIAEMLPE